jgi:hypothetical protein
MNKAVVVIPVYKPRLSAFEEIALKQCRAVLAKHTIIIVKPQSLVLDFDGNADGLSQVSFDDSYFEDIHGYNRLMLSADFYGRFSQYQYMLIYQLDAFVFDDQLNHWCTLGYDYIGAPWFENKLRTNIFDKAIARVKNYLYVRYNVKYKDGMPKIGKQLAGRVGNGGFSLRNISLLTELCVRYKPTIDTYCGLRHAWFNEDIFWSIELNRKKKQLNIPPLKKALQFAFETHPDRALGIIEGKLPFGCHAWDKNTDFWRPYFEQQGYQI